MTNVQICPEPKSAKFSQQTLNLKKRLSKKFLLSLEKTTRDFPRRAERSLASAGLKVKFIEVDKFSPQEYKIEIGTKGVIVFGGSESGLFFGFQSLVQILFQCENKIPCGVIQDTPDIDARSFHLDLRVHKYKPVFVKEIFRELSKLKYNTVVLEYQDTFPFVKEKCITGDIHFTKEQIAEISKAANENLLELIPYQNVIGQLDYILGLEPYSNLAAPSTVEHLRGRILDISNSKAVRFFSGLLDELSNAHTSKKIFIGNSRITDDDSNITEKHAAFIASLARHAANKGKIPIVWADLFNKFPKVLAELPKKTIIVIRHESTQTELLKQIKFFSDAGFDTAASPTILKTPDNEFARDTARAVTNIAEAAKNVKKSPANCLFIYSSVTVDAAPLIPVTGYPVDLMAGARRMHINASLYALACASEFAWNASASEENCLTEKWPLAFFGADDKKFAQVQLALAKDYFSGATNAEILRDRKKVLKVIAELKPSKNKQQLDMLEFYARLAIHAVHVRQIFSHTPKKQELALLRTEIARLKAKHSAIMKDSLYSREIVEEQKYFFGHTETLLKRLTRK